MDTYWTDSDMDRLVELCQIGSGMTNAEEIEFAVLEALWTMDIIRRAA